MSVGFLEWPAHKMCVLFPTVNTSTMLNACLMFVHVSDCLGWLAGIAVVLAAAALMALAWWVLWH